MKHAEIRAKKEALRQDIKSLATAISTFLTTKQKIPDQIINGTLSQVVAFKDYAEKAGSLYHVNYEPGAKMTAKQLEAVKKKLSGVAGKLGLVKLKIEAVFK